MANDVEGLYRFRLSEIDAARKWADDNGHNGSEVGDESYWNVAMNLIPSATVLTRDAVRPGG